MGGKKLKTVLLMVLAIVSILLTSNAKKLEASAKESDFTIEKGILLKYTGSDKKVVIPKGVTTIGVGVFKGCKMVEVTIPNSVTKIEDEAFRDCIKLTEIMLPDSVRELGQSAFQGCSSLKRAKLSGIYDIGISAFASCSSLMEVILPEGITSISHYAFQNCTSLEIVDLPESINFIGGGCFEDCTSLETILLPTQVDFIGGRAFANTPWIENYDDEFVIINETIIKYRGSDSEVTIPSGITVIGYGAFENCSFITNVNIPNGVKEIGIDAFTRCSSLTKIVVPDSVVIIDSGAFYDCFNLESISIPKNVFIRRDSIQGTKWLNDYKGDFVVLNDNLLGYQGQDSKVVIPDHVTSICTGAFQDNNTITEIIVPNSVNKIRYASFYNCRNLQKIVIPNKNTEIEYQSVLDCNSKLTIYGIAGGAVEEYARWSNTQFMNFGINKSKVTLYLEGNNTTTLSISDNESPVQWESENSTIAKVSSTGKVTAVKVGTTKVKTNINGQTMTCVIVVKKPYISKSSLSLMVSQVSRLNIVGMSSKITWSSGNSSVASINNKGVITTHKAGTTTITATVNGIKFTCKVIVK